MTDPTDDAKRNQLARRGALHPHPERVTDPLFQHGPFFDARDAVQVKYEMLRAVRVERRSGALCHCDDTGATTERVGVHGRPQSGRCEPPRAGETVRRYVHGASVERRVVCRVTGDDRERERVGPHIQRCCRRGCADPDVAGDQRVHVVA